MKDKLDQLMDAFNHALWEYWRGRGTPQAVDEARTALRDFLETPRPEVEPNEPCKHRVERRGYSRGYDMCWCDGCGKLLWCSDGVIPAGKEKNDDYGTWCAQRVVAWGCQSETDGGARCSRACGNCVMRVNAALSPLGRPE